MVGASDAVSSVKSVGTHTLGSKGAAIISPCTDPVRYGVSILRAEWALRQDTLTYKRQFYKFICVLRHKETKCRIPSTMTVEFWGQRIGHDLKKIREKTVGKIIIL